MKKKCAPVAVAFVLVNVQIVMNVHLAKIINPLNQIKKKWVYSGNFQKLDPLTDIKEFCKLLFYIYKF